MSGYLLPVGDVFVSDTWKGHKDRTPPSSEPGTDYAAAYGTPLVAVDDGVVTSVKTTNSAATGRYVQYRLDDGRETRSLHLSTCSVSVGDRVRRGETIGKSGASANGSDYGVGAHVHQTLWPGAAWAANTIDFQKYVGEEEDMPTADEIAKAVWNYSMSGADGADDPNAVPTETAGTRLRNVRRSTDKLKGRTERIDSTTKTIDKNTTPKTSTEAHVLSGPAWLIAAFLAALFVVEIVNAIVEARAIG